MAVCPVTAFWWSSISCWFLVYVQCFFVVRVGVVSLHPSASLGWDQRSEFLNKKIMALGSRMSYCTALESLQMPSLFWFVYPMVVLGPCLSPSTFLCVVLIFLFDVYLSVSLYCFGWLAWLKPGCWSPFSDNSLMREGSLHLGTCSVEARCSTHFWTQTSALQSLHAFLPSGGKKALYQFCPICLAIRWKDSFGWGNTKLSPTGPSPACWCSQEHPRAAPDKGPAGCPPTRTPPGLMSPSAILLRRAGVFELGTREYGETCSSCQLCTFLDTVTHWIY